MSLLASYSRLLRPYRRGYAIGLTALAATNALYLAIPRVLGAAVDDLDAGAGRDVVLRWAGVIVVLAATQAAFRILSRVQVLGISRRVDYDLKGKVHSKLLRLAPSFYDVLNTGDLMSRMTNDVMLVRAVAGPGIMYFTNAVLVYVLALAFMVTLDWRLTIAVFLPMPLMAWLVRGLVHRSKEYALGSREALSTLNTVVQENLAGAQVVKSFALEESQVERFDARSRAYVDWSLREARTRAVMIPIVGLSGGISYVAILGIGGHVVARGGLSLGDLVAFLAYVTMIVFPSLAFGWILSLLQRGAAAQERLEEILQAPETIAATPGAGRPLPEVRGDIEVRDLTFRYGDTFARYRPAIAAAVQDTGARRAALEGVGLRAAAGEVVAVVGRVGSGKSTLLKSLLRLIEVPEGTVFLDGRDVSGIDPSELRRRVGFVPQDDFLFSDSLAENIAFASPDAGRDRVAEIARIAGLGRELDADPGLLDRAVGERGLSLSGGQRQRVALARALLVNPSVLVLDNALSNVDTETESRIVAALAAGRDCRTVIVASNRINAIRGADRIYVLDRGRVVDTGKHDELAGRPGLYARMHEQQRLSDRLEAF